MSESHLLRMRIIPEIGTFAPLFMHMRINAKIFCFWPYIGSKNFINYTIRLNSTRAIDWYINFHAWLEKKIRPFFWWSLKFSNIFSLTTPKKSRIFFSNQAWKFIHQSIALVEFSRIVLFIKFIKLRRLGQWAFKLNKCHTYWGTKLPYHDHDFNI